MKGLIFTVIVLCLLVFQHASAQEPVTPWRSDPIFQRLAALYVFFATKRHKKHN